MRSCFVILGLPWLLRSEVENSDRGRDEFIVKNWVLLAAAAFEGSLMKGRGAIVLDLYRDTGLGLSIAYAATNSLTEWGCLEAQPELKEWLESYVPSGEFLLMMVCPDEELRYRRLNYPAMLSPAEAYRNFVARRPPLDPALN